MRILVLNGPNLNLLGTRRPEVYGSTTLAELDRACRHWGSAVGLDVETFQSNHEGALIDRIHAARGGMDGIVFNPGAYTHSSYALHDAIEAVEIPTVEVHISNVEEREEWRRRSLLRPACVHTIYGRGVDGYRWAIRHLFHRLSAPATRVTYGETADQFVDVRTPPGNGPHPLAVLVHGGFWRHMWTFDTVEGAAVDLVGRGVATAVVEYRRVGATSPGPAAMVADVVAACRTTRSLDRVDPDRVALVGHSAGGHLALLAAAEVPAMLVVGLAAVTDLTTDTELGAGAGALFLAGEDPARWSPCRRVPLGVPALLVHGTGDDRVPVSQSRRLAELATAAGDSVELLVLEGTGHFEFLDPQHLAWRDTARRVVDRL
jgi:3-dehydroquinate dehydratase type II